MEYENIWKSRDDDSENILEMSMCLIYFVLVRVSVKSLFKTYFINQSFEILPYIFSVGKEKYSPIWNDFRIHGKTFFEIHNVFDSKTEDHIR